MSDEDYSYPPDYKVLRNKLGFRDAQELDFHEREFVAQRIAQGVPSGDFDLVHLRAIHRHLFQDVYDWAGEIRTVEISKGGSQFQFRRFIEAGMADVHRRLVASRYLHGLGHDAFALKAGEIIGDVNYVHPFREGNGRTQLIYLEQLAERAGHRIDLTKLDRDMWMAASREAHLGQYEGLARAIAAAVSFDREPNGRTRKR